MEGFTIKELEKILSEGDFDSLIGKIENDFFDCKTGIYDLTKNSKKRELAKDVSSFANSNGGYILIGPQTPQTEKEKSKNHLGDEVIKILLLDQNLVDPNQYRKIIKEWISPDEIEKLDIFWKASKNDKNKGIIVIKIPLQKEISKPFLIQKFVEENNKISEVIFGYAERRGDNSDPKKSKDIHKIMRDGLLYDKNIENRFNNLEALVQTLIKKKEEKEQEYKDIDIINKRVNKTLQSYDEQ